MYLFDSLLDINLLALESSTSLTSVALLTPRGLLLREDDGRASKASDVMLAMVDALLAEAQLDKAALHAVACGQGPGAFTGLRTACAVSQGLAFGLGVQAVGVTSMQALAEQAYAANGATRVMAVMDARMNELYAQALVREANGEWSAARPISVVPVSELVWPEGDAWCAIGNAWHSQDLGESLRAATPANIHIPPTACVPHAREVALIAVRIAARKFAATSSTTYVELSAMMIEPLYVRDRVAQTTAERLAAKAKAALA